MAQVPKRVELIPIALLAQGGLETSQACPVHQLEQLVLKVLWRHSARTRLVRLVVCAARGAGLFAVELRRGGYRCPGLCAVASRESRPVLRCRRPGLVKKLGGVHAIDLVQGLEIRCLDTIDFDGGALLKLASAQGPRVNSGGRHAPDLGLGHDQSPEVRWPRDFCRASPAKASDTSAK